MTDKKKAQKWVDWIHVQMYKLNEKLDEVGRHKVVKAQVHDY